tara:strand:+ start:3695 stop:4738 length:1044 start_codon:yes stop_codon:yes gene_type:complete
MSIKILNENYYYHTAKIGEGSFSSIYKGYNYNNELVAIKKITKLIDKKHFCNEIELMKKLEHCNILKFYDAIVKKGKHFIILEYCAGGTLADYISSDSHEYNSKYFYESISGLEYLYLKDIIHRDIKPHNILIHNHCIKISDFGFAKSFEKNELITTFCGSPLYMAPEIILEHEYDLVSDMWSLGVVLYELITKYHPYSCENRKELWSKMRRRDLNIIFDDIQSQYKCDIIKKMLTFNRKNRLSWDELFVFTRKPRSRSIDFHEPIQICIPSTHTLVCSEMPIIRGNTHTYEDSTVISKSAPNKIHSYMKTIINNDKTVLLGASININKHSNNFLSRSISKFWPNNK